MNGQGQSGHPVRVEHNRSLFRKYLSNLPPGSQIAIESAGNWYWMIDEMERAGPNPKLVHATKAKMMMGQINKADKLDARGLAFLLRNGAMPPYTSHSMESQLDFLDQLEIHIMYYEKQIKAVVQASQTMELLMTLPGVGKILTIFMTLEIGDVSRFPGPEHLASYSGTVPRIKSSGGKGFYGRVRPDVNRYLKWAFVEAANSIVVHQNHYPNRHVNHLYMRIREPRGHAKHWLLWQDT